MSPSMPSPAARSPSRLTVLWLQSGGCGGCTMSLLCADTPDFGALLADAGLDLLWHPSLSLASGDEVRALLEDCRSGRQRLDVLCVEGAILRGPGGSGRFHLLAGTGRPMMDWVRELASVARHVVAVGSCAAWGGMSAVAPLAPGGVAAGLASSLAGGLGLTGAAGAGHPLADPTEACGLQYEDERPGGLLGADFRAGGGLPVVNVAGCPTHPGWVIETLMALAEDTLTADALDALARPRFYADHLVHHGCTRNEFYEFKASAEKPGDLGCMMEHQGCKGTQAHADCNSRPWNGDGSCTRGGYGCISCTEPGFQNPGHAFDSTPKLAGIPIGLPTDMPKAWFVALASLSKSATPKRVKTNATADHRVVPPTPRKTRLG
ncbi:MAG: ubiquinone oxidoreductase, 20 kDa subunit HupU [Pseudomonadota bacterium]